MNNDNFNNMGPMQNNMNPGMPGVQPDPNMGMQTMAPQNNMNPGMSGVQPDPNMPQQPQVNPNMYGYAQQYHPNIGGENNSPKNAKNMPLIIGASVGGGLLLLLIILFATGIIGGKTLTCSQSEETYGISMKEELKFYFKDDKVNKVVGKMTMDYGDNTMYKEMLQGSFEEQIADLKEEGIDAKLTSNNTSMTLTVTAKKDSIEEAFGVDSEEENSYKEIKERYEDQGYTCK